MEATSTALYGRPVSLSTMKVMMTLMTIRWTKMRARVQQAHKWEPVMMERSAQRVSASAVATPKEEEEEEEVRARHRDSRNAPCDYALYPRAYTV